MTGQPDTTTHDCRYDGSAFFGIFRPVLLLRGGTFDHLAPEQMSILAQELCHIGRRDNLAGVMQMFVETALWFHPLVWWIGKRIFQERERACDEEVLRLGNQPRVYAQASSRSVSYIWALRWSASPESPAQRISERESTAVAVGKLTHYRVPGTPPGTILARSAKLCGCGLVSESRWATDPILTALFCNGLPDSQS